MRAWFGRALAFCGGSACGEARLVIQKSHGPKEQKEQKEKQEEQKRTRREGRTRVYRALGVPKERERERERNTDIERRRKTEENNEHDSRSLELEKSSRVRRTDTHRSPIPKSAGRLSCLRTPEPFGCSYFIRFIYVFPRFRSSLISPLLAATHTLSSSKPILLFACWFSAVSCGRRAVRLDLEEPKRKR